jgi:outer membrane protein assembly factor BamB
MRSIALSSGFLALLLSVNAAAATPDWPQFHGPHRDAVCAETGLLQQWPAAGPKLLWTLKGLGRGYSTVSIVDGKLYTMGDRKQGDAEQQVVMAYDLASRKELWATPIGPPHRDGGPRATPTIDGKQLYVLGTEGDLACLETATGKIVWRKNLTTDFGGKMMCMKNGTFNWRYSESPLVDGERLLCTPGAAAAMMVALNKQTGAVVWKCAAPNLGANGADGAGYASMVAAEIAGVRQYVQFVGRGVIGVEAASGRLLWSYNYPANNVANITTPIVRGDYVFASSAYKAGSGMVKIVRQGQQFRAEEVYALDFKTFSNHHGGVVLVGDCLYGADGQNGGAPTCIDFRTGNVLWKEKGLGKRSAAFLYADGRFYVRYENNLMTLLEASPKGLQVKGSFQVPTKLGPAWPHPVIHQRKLYLRDHDELLCYDLAG